jgi:membrane-associated phospholipid phosphatase
MALSRLSDRPRTETRGRAGWRLWPLPTLFVLFLAGSLWLALSASGSPASTTWDGRVTDALVAARTPGLSRLLWVFTILGDTPVMTVLISMTVIMLLAWGKWTRAILLAGAMASAQGLSSLSKAVFQRLRPPQIDMLIKEPGSYSFPSGHAFLSVVFIGLLLFLVFRWLDTHPRSPGSRAASAGLRAIIVAVAAAVTALVGLSRVYLGVHWTSDVLAGWCFGAAWLSVALGVFLAWERRGRSWLDSRPIPRTDVRAALVAVLLLATALVVFLAVRSDPLYLQLMPD